MINLKIGQELKDKTGNEYKVLEIFTNSVVLASSLSNTIYSYDDLRRFFVLPAEKFEPKQGDAYWYIDNQYIIRGRTWVDSPHDKLCLEYGSCFPTKELAEQALQVVKEALIKFNEK